MKLPLKHLILQGMTQRKKAGKRKKKRSKKKKRRKRTDKAWIILIYRQRINIDNTQ